MNELNPWDIASTAPKNNFCRLPSCSKILSHPDASYCDDDCWRYHNAIIQSQKNLSSKYVQKEISQENARKWS